ncbi:hypothetical protein K491DRAFT_778430 [Lophiostoma macrostomum CBS 122681]|uniref:Uncharacterized protein n=1 Tax=Lophiostoma macrostomum CBS 122681 TaxID=1314788 RepID=A0A6A6T9G7_9PLEO|nr:hypothetical protein K491DRAFT_778430 [Lophiostoma macrostomum CBS 122681]
MSDIDVFTNEFKALPADAPTSHPHIIDVGKIKMAQLPPSVKLWDVIATLLLKLSTDTLTKFLDTSVQNCKTILKCTRKGQASECVVWRQEREVVAGTYTDCLTTLHMDIFEWDNLVKCVIKDDGSWEVKYASYRQYSVRDLDSVWRGEFVEPVPGFKATIPQDEWRKAELATLLGENILYDIYDSVELAWKATTTT